MSLCAAGVDGPLNDVMKDGTQICVENPLRFVHHWITHGLLSLACSVHTAVITVRPASHLACSWQSLFHVTLL